MPPAQQAQDSDEEQGIGEISPGERTTHKEAAHHQEEQACGGDAQQKLEGTEAKRLQPGFAGVFRGVYGGLPGNPPGGCRTEGGLLQGCGITIPE